MVYRTRIFIDFWNFLLTAQANSDQKLNMDWQKLPPWLMEQASNIVRQELQYDGTGVYISYSPKSQKDKNLRHFATHILDYFPGFSVQMIERQPRNAPVCQSCHEEIIICPTCSEKLERTVEKGVDTWVITDIFRLAWEGSLDVIILISSDGDFIPMVETLSRKGFKVINGHFRPNGMQLASACWGSINLKDGLDIFSKNVPANTGQ